MAGNIYHSWNGTVLTITSDSGTSSCDLKGATGDTGIRGPQGIQGEKGEKGAGEKGDTGAAFTYDMFTPEQLAALTGPEGPTGKTGETGAPFTYDMFTEAQLESLRGPQGIQGKQGIQGEIGPAGKDGVGIPTGGTTGQILTKASAADYDTKWADAASGYAYNLLDNSDFRNPVNQRGKTNYTGGGYTIDRWVLGVSTVVVNVLDDGIEITGGNPTYNAPYIQKVPENLTGKTVTLAVCDSDGVIETVTGTVQTDSACSTNTTYGSIAFYHSSSDGTLWAQINVNYGGSKIFRWAALYEGSYTAETLPPYVPKGYAAELAECQRYYELLNNGSSQFVKAYNSSFIAFAINYAEKRISPTISVTGSLTNALSVAGVGTNTPTSINSANPVGLKSARINAAGTFDTSYTYNIIYSVVKLEINADL